VTKPVRCGVCGDFLKMLEAATDTPWTTEERTVLLARAEASIEESERVMLLRMPCSDRIQ